MRIDFLLNAVSLTIIFIGFVLFLPVITAICYHDINSVVIFSSLGLITVLSGYILNILVKKLLPTKLITDVKKIEALSVVLLTWIIFSIISSLPYMLYGIKIVDALFEGVAGATTTGATIFTHFDYPKTLFFWRALTQWIGGMGIIVLFVAVLPQFAVAGRQMFFAEAPGPSEDTLTPRIKNTAIALWGLYVLLTVIQIILLVYFKMPLFDAICNSFATIASGGFSPHQNSIIGYNSIPICWVTIVFMILAGCNLALVYRITTFQKVKLLWTNEEFKTYIFIIIAISLGIFAILCFNNNAVTFSEFTNSVFTTVSVITSTGFASCDYSKWSISAQILLLILMITGASAGSTGGGLKISRVLIIAKHLKREFVKIIHPNAVITIKSDNITVAPEIVSQIISFAIFYTLIFFINAILVTIIENNAVIGFAGSLSTISLTGPAFGDTIGATGNFSSLHTITKFIFMFNMLVGRLELVPVLMLFNADYWYLKK